MSSGRLADFLTANEVLRPPLAPAGGRRKGVSVLVDGADLYWADGESDGLVPAPGTEKSAAGGKVGGKKGGKKKSDGGEKSGSSGGSDPGTPEVPEGPVLRDVRLEVAEGSLALVLGRTGRCVGPGLEYVRLARATGRVKCLCVCLRVLARWLPILAP